MWSFLKRLFKYDSYDLPTLDDSKKDLEGEQNLFLLFPVNITREIKDANISLVDPAKKLLGYYVIIKDKKLIINPIDRITKDDANNRIIFSGFSGGISTNRHRFYYNFSDKNKSNHIYFGKTKDEVLGTYNIVEKFTLNALGTPEINILSGGVDKKYVNLVKTVVNDKGVVQILHSKR